MGTSTATVFADIEVGSICVAGKHHATSSVEDTVARVRGNIIEELEKGSIGIFGGRILLLANIIETNK